jgi:hypothetical protein
MEMQCLGICRTDTLRKSRCRMVAKNQSSNQNDMHVMGGQITESYPKDKEYPAETCPAVGAAGRVRKVTGTPTPSSLSLEA